MLIVEGSDLVGKTTLIKALCDEATNRGHPMIPQHFGLLPDNWDFLCDYMKFINNRTVMDRFIMSEVVYGETLRKKSRITPEHYSLLQTYLDCFRYMTVVIVAETVFFKEHVHKQFEYRDEVFKEEQICLVNEAFIEVINTCKLGEFKLSFDIAHCVSNDREFPSSDPMLVDEIVETYLKFQDEKHYVTTD